MLESRTHNIWKRMNAEGKVRTVSVHEVHRSSYDDCVHLKAVAEQKQRASRAYATGRVDLDEPSSVLSDVYHHIRMYVNK